MYKNSKTFKFNTEMLTRSDNMKNKHLIDPMDFSKEELEEIFNLAHQIISNPKEYSHVCDGKILATLFYEPSTRTRFSFEAAMMRLGGKILGFSEPNSSSTAKGETLADTITMVSIYSDIIAMRHPMEGSAKLASMYSQVPVINAGDGGHQHPTQTLTDLLTIDSLKDGLYNHTIGICGDLKNGRTVHSLIKAMSRYEGTKFVLISPKELSIPDYIRDEILLKNNIEFKEVEKLEEVISELDILYMTRIQKERFFNEEEYLRLKDSYILDVEKMNLAKDDMIVLHPLPRVNEIAIEVDKDDRACYFKQAEFGMYVRMALIAKLLGVV
jgi:aspartate carbamoyltransferase catalytic subunit